MDRIEQRVDWNNLESSVLLNPRIEDLEQKKLLHLAQVYSFPAHLWIASSGSAQIQNQSVKLVALSKKSLLKSAHAVNGHLQIDKNDKWFLALPVFHVGGLGILARAFLSEGRVISVLKNETWDIHFFMQKVLTEKITLGSLVPTQIYDLIKLKLQAPPTLRAIIVGGAALSENLYKQALELGWPLLPSYGMTEACSQIATAQLHDSRLKILSHWEYKTDQQNILYLKGESLLTGYAQYLGESHRFIDPKDKQGWLKTEDRVEIEGNILKPMGRADDFIKILGEGVSLHNLDNLLQNIIEAKLLNSKNFCICPIDDQRQGKKIILAYVSPEEKENSQLIKNNFNFKVLPFERISDCVMVERIPRTDLGKPKRHELSNLISQIL